MRKIIFLTIIYFFFISSGAGARVIKDESIFTPGNIRANIWNTGVLFQSLRTINTPGFEWPKNSGKHAIFTAGLSTGCLIDGNLRLGSASYEASMPRDILMFLLISLRTSQAVFSNFTQYVLAIVKIIIQTMLTGG
ncbi:MAG: hypothetical protein K1X86_16485 [Ignavibacteria bacterium]|nr:hypothetical protein [Ignavibacteria bacterium]